MEHCLLSPQCPFGRRVRRLSIRLPLEYDSFVAAIKDASPVLPGELDGQE
jgi:hypothetical protein